jgi:hypothetical protein
MRVRAWSLAAALVLSAAFTGCSEERSSPTPPPPAAPRVDITALAASAVANGTNTVGLSVTDTGGATVNVSTSLGTFDPTGFTTAVVPNGSGTVTLRTCNGCSGTAFVTATSQNGTDQATVQFVTLASACLGNCSVDAACPGQTCNLSAGGTGTCSATTCVAPPACVPSAASETSCGNGTDEDCNGDVDCADGACDGQPCPGGAMFACQSGRCTDLTSGLAVVVTPARARLPANGTTTTAVDVEVTADATPLASVAVSISTTFGAVAPATGVTGADGKVRFTFSQTSASAGVAVITAGLVAAPGVTGSGTITLPKLGALELVVEAPPGSVQYPVMGVKASGWREYGWIQVHAVDDKGLPYPDDLAVGFEHRSLGGSTFADPLSPDTATCIAPECFGSAGLVASPGDAPDTTGLANAWVYPGTVAGTLAFTATASAGGVTRTVLLPTIAVVGAKASGSNFSIVCSPRNLPALAETDCSISLVDAPFTCQALLKDRFGNVLGRETQVFFRSEAASVGQVVWTPAYDGAAGPQMDLGLATQSFTTLGSGLPFDVDPDTTALEPSELHALDGCGPRTHNPRDGVVTMVALADGEEAFWDVDGNGSMDAGEPFVDLGEPFVDQDDNGQWDAGEWYLDVDHDSAYTPANGRWDAQKKLWTQTVVVYTGTAQTRDVTGGRIWTRIAGDDFVDACLSTAIPAGFDVLNSTTTAPGPRSETYALVASDMNFNFLNAGTKYAVTKLPDDTPVDLIYYGLEQYRDDVGWFYRYWPCDQNGECASQCRATGAAAPCTMTPSIASYSCGLTTAVTIIGGTEPGGGSIRWGVDVPWKIYDNVDSVLRQQVPLSGVVR